MKHLPLSILLSCVSFYANAQEPQITEFLASNGSGIVDGNGDHSDWIEVHNPSGTDIDLTGWHITDDEQELTQYTFPTGSVIPAGEYQIIFASKDSTPPAGEWHTNFSLSSNGEYLALVRPDGATVVSDFAPTYPEQLEDYSYGPDADNVLKYYSTPTPGAPNGTGLLGFVADTDFSHNRGFYDSPFDVTVTASDPDADIRYTLDGSEPSLTNGFTYTNPVTVATTTTLRVRAYKTGFLETNVDTQTYLFPADIIQQPKVIPNYPNNSYDLGSGNDETIHDYEMDPAIVNDPNYNTKIIDALKAIPTVSLVTNRNEMFGSNGFYDSNDNESRTSVEVIYPDSPEASEQTDGGVEGHSHIRLKRSLRLNFRKDLGESSFKTDLFKAMPWSPEGENEHDVIILRGGNNRAWSRNWSKEKCSFSIDELARQMQLGTSGYGMRGSFVHLYINGLYWGMYNAVERADEHFAERYFDGDADDWSARNHGGDLSGPSTRYNQLIGEIKDKDMSVSANYSELQEYVDTEGFIDYMLVQWLNATSDWPNNNWYGVNRNETSPLGSTPMRFLTWDSEWSWDLPRNSNDSATEPWVHPDFRKNKTKNQGADIPRIFNSAKDSPDFIRSLGDRAYKHLMNDGSLSDNAMQARYTAITNTVKDPVIAESARWGDSLIDFNEPTYTRDLHWQNEVDHILSLMPGRGAKLIAALRVEEYYPSIDPPILNQRGGNVIAGFIATLTNPNNGGIIKYTLDGSDPADPSNAGALTYTSGITITETVQIRARIESGAEWSAQDDVIFFVLGPPAIVISEIMYHPSAPSAAEVAAGFTEDDFEYIEIHNRGDETLELENIVFTDGIEFTFPEHLLVSGGRVIVASNTTAHAFRYGSGAATTVFGGFTSGKLSDGGETLRLESALGELITELTYDDSPPWPVEADGEGFSIIFTDTPGADPSQAESWRRSGLTGGSPGTGDSLNYDLWITHNTPGIEPSQQMSLADPDGDGIANIIEYAFDLNPLVQDSDKLPRPTQNGDEISVTYDIDLFKNDIVVLSQTSDDVSDWSKILYTATQPAAPNGFRRTKINLDTDQKAVLFRFKVTLP